MRHHHDATRILSVSQPIRFQRAMASREAEVKEKLNADTSG